MKLFELQSLKKLPWHDPDIGWWQDNTPILLYHGTNIANIQKIIDDKGLKAGGYGESADWVSLTLDPNTAYGYAGNSGGAVQSSKSKKRTSVPREERAIVVIEIPNYKKLTELKGEVSWECSPQLRDVLEHKDKYEAEKKKGKHDSEIYLMSEIRFPKEIPISLMKGYMIK